VSMRGAREPCSEHDDDKCHLRNNDITSFASGLDCGFSLREFGLGWCL